MGCRGQGNARAEGHTSHQLYNDQSPQWRMVQSPGGAGGSCSGERLLDPCKCPKGHLAMPQHPATPCRQPSNEVGMGCA